MKEKSNKSKIVIFLLVLVLVIGGIIGLGKLSEYFEFLQNKSELCSYDFQSESQYNTANACFEALLNLSKIQEENHSAISGKISLEDEIEEKLKNYNNEKFCELATNILKNTNVQFEFSDSEIINTFLDRGSSITYIEKDYKESKYRNAFSAFLTFFRDEDYGELDNIKYEYDCIYYICHSLYPKTFDQGIIDTFLSVGVYSWGSSGSERLEETISYVSSSPEGIKPYESYIATAKKQLEEKNAIEDSKPKHYCVECGAKATYSSKHIFSGQTEWYCYSCYKELEDLLDQFGLD